MEHENLIGNNLDWYVRHNTKDLFAMVKLYGNFNVNYSIDPKLLKKAK